MPPYPCPIHDEMTCHRAQRVPHEAGAKRDDQPRPLADS
jgi:hypothetical protein